MDPGSPAHGQAWALLIGKYGQAPSWPRPIRIMAKNVFHMTVAIFWRHFAQPFLGYPWCLAQILDPQLTEQQRLDARQRL
eukprot:12008197-Karenia_brevis.AAC.1